MPERPGQLLTLQERMYGAGNRRSGAGSRNDLWVIVSRWEPSLRVWDRRNSIHLRISLDRIRRLHSELLRPTWACRGPTNPVPEPSLAPHPPGRPGASDPPVLATSLHRLSATSVRSPR